MSKWNGKRFSVYTSEEKTTLGLIKELGEQTNFNTEEVERIEREKTDLYGDHKGTWQGLNKPTLSEEGMKATVEQITNKSIPNIQNNIVDIETQLAEKANKDEVTNVMTPKGTIAYASLPVSGNEVGWYYYCPDGDGTNGPGNYVWNGTVWYFGGTGDEGYSKLKGDLRDKKTGYLKKITSDLISGAREDIYERLNIEWEQGSFTSTGFTDSTTWIRTVDPFYGGVFIHNTNPESYAIAIGRWKADDAWNKYMDIGSNVISTHVYADEWIWLPVAAKADHKYRIEVRKYPTAEDITVDENPIELYRAIGLFSAPINNELSYATAGEIVPYMEEGSVLSTGLTDNNVEVRTRIFEIGNKNDAFTVNLLNDKYRYAIYWTVNDGATYGTNGWSTSAVTIKDRTKKYRIRVGLVSYDTEFDLQEAKNAISITFHSGSIKSIGYKRNYIDITSDLTFEQKTITTSGISESTTNVIAKLPNNGNIEVKLNAPSGKFAIYKVSSSGTISLLTGDFIYYQYRYTGDYTSEYYVRINTSGGGALSPRAASQFVKVYKYSDTGCNYDVVTSLYGKKVAFIGDSIVQGRFAKNGSSVNMVASKPYSNLISEVIGEFNPHNYGIGGALVYNSDWKSLYLNCSNVSGYDTVFVCAGTNDYGNDVSENDFRTAFQYVINTLKENNDKVIVCTPTYRTSKTGTNNVGLSLSDYVDIEKELATETEVKIIDLYSLTNNSNWIAHIPDGLHPDEIGHQILSNLILEQYELIN